MKRTSAARIVLDLLIAAVAVAALYVWLIGPIVSQVRIRPVNWEDPMRPLRLAIALLALRLLVRPTELLWVKVRSPVLRGLRSVPVWILIVAIGAFAWWYTGHRAWTRVEGAVRAARAAGHVQIDLVTRPLLDTPDLWEGVVLPEASAGSVMEISCGLPLGAEKLLDRSDDGWDGVLLIGDREVGRCPLQPGAWSEVEFRVPEGLRGSDRLHFEVAGGGSDADRIVYWSPPHVQPEPDPNRPNLILISMDTLRPDHLGIYGHHRPSSPNIDDLARAGVLFEEAIAQAPWTTPSHMSLFTSLFPTVHAVDSPTSVRQRRLPEERTTLARILSDAGWLTAAFTGSGSISAVYGFWRGFDLYDETDKDDPERRGEDISAVFEKSTRWIWNHRDRPFFLFFHTYETHAPFTHETFLDDRLEQDEMETLAALYDGDILYADGFIGQLLELLDSLDLRRRTIVVFLSDHGEELIPRYPGERFGHGHTVYDDLLRVPLIVSAPGRIPEGVRVAQRVQLIDVMPTLLELMDLPVPEGLQGVSFAGAFRGEPPQDRPAFAEATNYGPERKAILDGDLKYIRTFPRDDEPAREIAVEIPREELFDLAADPLERHSILSRDAAGAERLRARLLAIVKLNESLRRKTESEPLDEETLRRLKALGYVQ